MQTAANFLAFFATLAGLLIAWALIYNGGSFKDPATWVMMIIGVGLEWIIVREVYKQRHPN